MGVGVVSVVLFLVPSDSFLLKSCDVLRDDRLAELGVRMEDKEGHTVVKVVGRDAILKEREREKQVGQVAMEISGAGHVIPLSAPGREDEAEG